VSCAKTAELIEIPFGVWIYGGAWVPKEPCIRWGPGSPHGKGHFGGYTRACPDLPAVSILKTYSLGGRSDAASG